MKLLHIAIISFCCLFPSGRAFVPTLSLNRLLRSSTVSITKAIPNNQESSDEITTTNSSRRDLLRLPVQLALLSQIQLLSPSPANAAGEKVKPQLTPDEGAAQLREGYKTILYLLDHYDEICEGGGDNVRRYLGTIVGNPPSALVGISKAMKALEDRADDFIEFTETSDEVIKSINQADGSAYMAIFVTTSTSYTPPAKYFADAKIEVKRCKKAMELLADMVDVKLA